MFGCKNSQGNTEKVDNQPEQQDTTKAVSEEEQLKAIGNINFFISEKDFKAEKEIFLKSVHNPKSDEEFSSAQEYCLGDYEFLRLDGDFDNDSLFFVSLVGLLFSDKYTPMFGNQYRNLLELLTAKYGRPLVHAKLPSEAQMISSKDVILAWWQLGAKNIVIHGYYENGTYLVNLESFRKDIVDKRARKRSVEHIKSTVQDLDKI